RCKNSHNGHTDQRSHKRHGSRNYNTQQLGCKKLVISKDQSIPASHTVNRTFTKQAGCDTAPDAADAVTAESIQRIVDLQFFLYKRYAKIADGAYHRANDKSRPDGDESCTGRDGNQ